MIFNTGPIDYYYKQMMSHISLLAEANEDHSEAIFFEECMQILIEDGYSVEHEEGDNGEINSGYKYTYLRQTGLKVDGYEFVIDRRLLILYVCHFVQSDEINTLTQTQISQFIKNTRRFFEKALEKAYLDSIEKTSDDYEVASFINKHHKKIDQLGISIITNCILSKRVKDTILTEEDKYGSTAPFLPTRLDIWDIHRLLDIEKD